MERGAVADLHIPDLLLVRVLGQLERGALERVALLEHLEREIEGLEIAREADARGQAGKKAAELLVRSDRKADSLFFSQREQRGRANRPVQVNVKIGFRECVEEKSAAPGVTPRRRPPSRRRAVHPALPGPCSRGRRRRGGRAPSAGRSGRGRGSPSSTRRARGRGLAGFASPRACLPGG